MNNPIPWMFYAYINLYTLSTYFAHIYGLNFYIALLNKKIIIDTYLCTSSLSLLAYSFLILYSSIYKKEYQFQFVKRKLNHLYIFILIFPITYYINSLTNWTEERVGLIASLAAYFRNITTLLTLLILITNNFSKRTKYIAVACCAIVTMVSTQRTNFFIIIIGVLLIERKSKNALLLMFCGIFFLLVVGSIRNGVNIVRILYPILGEGVFGSWGMLNAIDYYLNHGYNIYNVIKPLKDRKSVV
jgi:hypothetical protein